MKVFGWQWLVTSSVIFASIIVGSLAASAETRPQYGGTLHVAVRAAPSSLNSGDCAQPNSFASRNLALLIFQTLVTTEDGVRFRPALPPSSPDSSRTQPRQLRPPRRLTR